MLTTGSISAALAAYGGRAAGGADRSAPRSGADGYSGGASDDVAVSRSDAVWRSLSAQVGVLQDRISEAQTAEAGYAAAEGALVRIRDLQLQAQSPTATAEAVQAAQAEIDAAVEALRSTYDSTSYAGRSVLEAGDPVRRILEGGASALGDASATREALYDAAHRRAQAGAKVQGWSHQVQATENARLSAAGIIGKMKDMEAAQAAMQTMVKRMADKSPSQGKWPLFDVDARAAAALLRPA